MSQPEINKDKDAAHRSLYVILCGLNHDKAIRKNTLVDQKNPSNPPRDVVVLDLQKDQSGRGADAITKLFRVLDPQIKIDIIHKNKPNEQLCLEYQRGLDLIADILATRLSERIAIVAKSGEKVKDPDNQRSVKYDEISLDESNPSAELAGNSIIKNSFSNVALEPVKSLSEKNR